MKARPVLVGVGVAARKEEDPAKALEPLDLMIEAVRAAGQDSGAPRLLARACRIAIPRGRWSYRNPGSDVAAAIGAKGAQTVLSTVGVLQQTLIASACADIALGNIDSAIVTGADSGYRLLRARLTGVGAPEREQCDDPDLLLEPRAELRHPAELEAGLQMPVGLYALGESARRAAAGLTVEAHRDRLARDYAKFSAIAAGNPHAWDREPQDPEAIREDGPKNPMQAFPYTRSHCSTWNVDQAAALLLCSEELADELGIADDRRMYPLVSVEANHMVPLTARSNPGECVGAKIAADALFLAAGLAPEDIDLVELYSCFPLAVDCFAQAAHIPPDRDLTVTGGMSFAGGPYNNYFLQATARVAELLRSGAGRTALLSCVSGIMTKQAFALWSADRPQRDFARLDVTDDVASRSPVLPVETGYSGHGTAVAATVVYERGSAPKAVVLLDTVMGTRALATSNDAEVVRSIRSGEWVGRKVRVDEGGLAA